MRVGSFFIQKIKYFVKTLYTVPSLCYYICRKEVR
nr:MAG TPA: hypothetical protein [Bacteriophage sp.]